MRRLTSIFTALALIAPMAFSRPAAAVDAPYEAGLMRIAEVMGSLHPHAVGPQHPAPLLDALTAWAIAPYFSFTAC